jgi:hypothetical protein
MKTGTDMKEREQKQLHVNTPLYLLRFTNAFSLFAVVLFCNFLIRWLLPCNIESGHVRFLILSYSISAGYFAAFA